MDSRDAFNIPSGVPDVNLPLDEILQGTVPGKFAGVVGGTGSLSNVSGIKGQSLSFPWDAYLSYGMDNIDTCFHLPEHCLHGVTFSMWLWLQENMVEDNNIILSSDKNIYYDVGYRIEYKEFNKAVQVKLGPRLIHQMDEIYVDTGMWVHIAFTWHPDDILRVYANGCIAGHAFVNGSTRALHREEMRIGGKGGRWVTAEMKIDDLLVWYKNWYLIRYGLFMSTVSKHTKKPLGLFYREYYELRTVLHVNKDNPNHTID